MKCACGSKSIVRDTRPHSDGVWRQRKCTVCGDVFTTIEVTCTTVAPPHKGRPFGAKERPKDAPKMPRKQKKTAPAIAVVSKVFVAVEKPLRSSEISAIERIERINEERELNKL